MCKTQFSWALIWIQNSDGVGVGVTQELLASPPHLLVVTLSLQLSVAFCRLESADHSVWRRLKVTERLCSSKWDHFTWIQDPDISDSKFNILRHKNEVLQYTMEITAEDLITIYLGVCSGSPTLCLLLGTPVLGAKGKSTQFLVDLTRGKGAT